MRLAVPQKRQAQFSQLVLDSSSPKRSPGSMGTLSGLEPSPNRRSAMRRARRSSSPSAAPVSDAPGVSVRMPIRIFPLRRMRRKWRWEMWFSRTPSLPVNTSCRETGIGGAAMTSLGSEGHDTSQ